MRQKSSHTHTHNGDTVAHPQGQHLSVCPIVVSSARITVLYFKALSLRVCLSLCLSSFPPALSMGDRSEVADQAGHLSVWCNSLPSRQAASCDLMGIFVLMPETLCSIPVAHCTVPSSCWEVGLGKWGRHWGAWEHGYLRVVTNIQYAHDSCVKQVHLHCV